MTVDCAVTVVILFLQIFMQMKSYNLLCLASFSLSIIYFGSIHLAMHVTNVFLNVLSFFSFACD